MSRFRLAVLAAFLGLTASIGLVSTSISAAPATPVAPVALRTPSPCVGQACPSPSPLPFP